MKSGITQTKQEDSVASRMIKRIVRILNYSRDGILFVVFVVAVIVAVIGVSLGMCALKLASDEK